jgi:transposase-like protein
MLEGLRKPPELIVIVVTLLAYGCPLQAIVHAFGLDERTVANWRDRAGAYCEQVHRALVEAGKLDLVHVQADEIRVKGRKMIAWMGLARMVSTRPWLAGMVSTTRDKSLADSLMQQVRRSAQTLRPLLVLTDGWAAYPNSIRHAFRKTGQKAGRSRAGLFRSVAAPAHWDGHQADGEKTGRGDHPPDGSWSVRSGREVAPALGGGSVLNTAFIERLNGTFRERLASLTRRGRHAASRLQALHTGMYLIGCTYNFCCVHHELSKAKHWGMACTPAMESRPDRSYLERLRIVTLQSSAFTMGRTQTTGTTSQRGRSQSSSP